MTAINYRSRIKGSTLDKNLEISVRVRTYYHLESRLKSSDETYPGGRVQRDFYCGGVAERLKALAWRASGPKGPVGSNPTASAWRVIVAGAAPSLEN